MNYSTLPSAMKLDPLPFKLESACKNESAGVLNRPLQNAKRPSNFPSPVPHPQPKSPHRCLAISITSLVLFCSLPSAHAADASPESPKDARQLLQEGLFEEEASHDLGKAAAAYSALIAKVDAERALAATAIFRLAEVRAKQGKKDEAAALWQRILTEFPTQADLAKLSRERLAGLGVATTAGTAPDATSDEEAKALLELRDIAKNSPDLLTASNPKLESKTPLDNAAEQGWLEVADFLVRQGVKPNSNALFMAAAQGHKTMVDFLLDHGADINGGSGGRAKNYNGFFGDNALIAAIAQRRRSVIQRLLERGASLKPMQNGRAPLLAACENDDLELARLLLDKGADPNAATTLSEELQSDPYWVNGKKSPHSTLLLASRLANGPSGKTDLLELLLEKGAKPGVPGGEQATEIEDAIQQDNLAALHLLLPKLPKLTDSVPLRLAIASYDEEVLRLVIEHCADINLKIDGHTPPIIFAMRVQWLEAIPILLNAGASPKIADTDEKTPLHVLAEFPLQPMEHPQPAFKRSPSGGRSASTPASVQPPGPMGLSYSSPFAFPLIGVRSSTNSEAGSATAEQNREWAVRRPIFEALLAKGADLNARDKYGFTAFSYLLSKNCWATEAVDWFAAHGADIFAREVGTVNGERAALQTADAGILPELARRILLPKLAQPDAILIWGANDPLDKPSVYKHDAQHNTPPALLEIASEPSSSELPKEKADPAAGNPDPTTRHNSLQNGATLAVINRKDAEGKWAEVSVVRLNSPANDEMIQTKLQWGDAVFFCTSSGGYHRENLKEDSANPSRFIRPGSIPRPPTIPQPSRLPR